MSEPFSSEAGRASAVSKIQCLDGWRGLAIILVLLAHFFKPQLGVDFGRLGVCLFFVLSGRLMGDILFVRSVPIKLFFWRRLSRILPQFLLFIMVIFATGWSVAGGGVLNEFIPTLLFLRTYLPSDLGIWDSQLPIGHLWSLNVEEHTYIVLALIAVFSRRSVIVVPALLAMAAIGCILPVMYARHPNWAPHSGALGSEVASAYITAAAATFLLMKQGLVKLPGWLPYATFVAAILCFTPLVPWWATMISAPLLALSVNSLETAAVPIKQFFEMEWLRTAGLWSYALYLWQQPFYKYQHLFPPGVALILTVVVAYATLRLVENPVREYLNSRWTPRHG